MYYCSAHAKYFTTHGLISSPTLSILITPISLTCPKLNMGRKW